MLLNRLHSPGLSTMNKSAASRFTIVSARMMASCTSTPTSFAVKPSALHQRPTRLQHHDIPSSPYYYLCSTYSYCKSVPPNYRLADVVQQRHQRRWNSSSSASDSKGDDEYTSEQRKQDHKHCVELVRDRDMEGYCKKFYMMYFTAFIHNCFLLMNYLN